MIDRLSDLARQGLFLFDPETAHGLSITALKSGIVPSCTRAADARLARTVAAHPDRDALEGHGGHAVAAGGSLRDGRDARLLHPAIGHPRRPERDVHSCVTPAT